MPSSGRHRPSAGSQLLLGGFWDIELCRDTRAGFEGMTYTAGASMKFVEVGLGVAAVLGDSNDGEDGVRGRGESGAGKSPRSNSR